MVDNTSRITRGEISRDLGLRDGRTLREVFSSLNSFTSGEWTPVVSEGGAAIDVARFSKNRNTVFVCVDLNLTGTRTATYFYISGLPYKPITNTPGSCYTQIWTGGSHLVAAAVSLDSTIGFQKMGSNANGNEFGNGYLTIAITYITDE